MNRSSNPIYQRLVRNTHGIAMIEFAAVLPFMLLLLFGGIELTRFILITQRVEAGAQMLASIASQYPAATENPPAAAQISQFELTDNVFPLLTRILEPCQTNNCGAQFASTAVHPDYVSIITSFRREGNQTLIKWQLGGGGSLGGVLSRISGLGPNNPPTVAARNRPVSFTDADMAALANAMAPNENLIAAEIFYEYRPVFATLLGTLGVTITPTQLYRAAYVSPRNEPLICLPPLFTYSECP